jgi:hypothetical protein
METVKQNESWEIPGPDFAENVQNGLSRDHINPPLGHIRPGEERKEFESGGTSQKFCGDFVKNFLLRLAQKPVLVIPATRKAEAGGKSEACLGHMRPCLKIKSCDTFSSCQSMQMSPQRKQILP